MHKKQNSRDNPWLFDWDEEAMDQRREPSARVVFRSSQAMSRSEARERERRESAVAEGTLPHQFQRNNKNWKAQAASASQRENGFQNLRQLAHL